jgi:hypothetical protein
LSNGINVVFCSAGDHDKDWHDNVQDDQYHMNEHRGRSTKKEEDFAEKSIHKRNCDDYEYGCVLFLFWNRIDKK